MEMAASVTPCRQNADATVLDEHGQACARGSAAGLGGDVEGTHQVAVPLKSAVRAREEAAFGFGDAPPAGRAGGGGATLVHYPHADSGLLGLVAEGSQQVGAAPLPQPEVLHPSRIPFGDPAKIANHQGADPLSNGEGDHLLCRLVLGLVDATTMTCFDLALPGAMAPPTPRPTLSGFRGMTSCLCLACLPILEVEVVLGAERPPRYEESSVLGGHRVGMDDAKVDTGDPGRVEVLLLDRDGGGDGQPQSSAVGQQNDRSNLLW